MIHWLRRVYRRVGIHAAPPGTLFFLLHMLVRRIVHRRIFGFVTGNVYTRGKFGGVPYYDILHARKIRQVDGLALIYFMGAGDYLMTTPLIEALHLAHPDLPIHAYACTHTDHVNSPLVAQLLRVNPLIERVSPYDGRPRSSWWQYDFSDALKNIPKGFLILPVLYEIEPDIYHRVTSLLETFSLPVDLPVPPPRAYETALSADATIVFETIRSSIERLSPSFVVCTHFGARSSGYEYPHAADLIRRLIRLGGFVINFSAVDLADDHLTQIDITRISVTDSIELLRRLSKEPQPPAIISVNSLMWPVSAALDIPNLGLLTFADPALHQYLYPNIFVVTPHSNMRISPGRWFCPPGDAFRVRQLDGGSWFTDYKPDYVIDCFGRMRDLIS